MSWLKQTVSSSIGGKAIVALTGLGLVGFLVAHLAGNLLIFAGPQAMADYAEGLRKYPALLWAMRIGLIVISILHVTVAIKLNMNNRAARPVSYVKKDFVKASPASRSMVYTGVLVLAYALFHLAHFTFRVTSPEIGQFGPWDVYQMAVASFSDPLVAGTYILAMIVMGVHLNHGVSSLFQSLGLNHDKYNGLIRKLGPLLGALLALGFISIPVSVLLGIVR